VLNFDLLCCQWWAHGVATTLNVQSADPAITAHDRFSRNDAINAATAQLELTVQKSLFRMVGTVAGGVVGYCVMLKPQSANNPYAIMALACTIVFFASFPAHTEVSLHVRQEDSD